MTIFELLMGAIESVIGIMKAADFLMGISFWQLFILFLALTDLTAIVKAIFGGRVTND